MTFESVERSIMFSHAYCINEQFTLKYDVNWIKRQFWTEFYHFSDKIKTFCSFKKFDLLIIVP